MSCRHKPILTDTGQLVADTLMLLFAVGVFMWAIAGWIA
jgi:hypothetical protein